ncbi:hypothetical protein ACJJTC_019820 [Scirpophaga incertulas]
MFRALVLVFAIATVSATYYGDEYINYIDNDYEDTPRVILPYAYQNHRINAVVEEPVYAAKYETAVVMPALRSEDLSVSTIETKSVNVSSTGLLSLVFKAVSLVKSLIMTLVKSSSALVIGGVVAVGIYKLVSICFSASTFHYLGDVQSEIMSYATPDAINRATEFVVEAVRKYTLLQAS